MGAAEIRGGVKLPSVFQSSGEQVVTGAAGVGNGLQAK